jgi:hypothetical protein
LWEEVHLNLAYRWFCRLGLDGDVPDHPTLSKNRHSRPLPRERSAAAPVRDGATALYPRWASLPREALTLTTQNLSSTAFLGAFSASFREHWFTKGCGLTRHERFQMAYSLIGADRNTHLKTIAVAVAVAMLVVIFGITAR